MLEVNLLDGAKKQFDHPVSIIDIASSISPSLAQNTIAARVDGLMVDTSTVLKNNAQVFLMTVKDEAALDIIRHSTAHLMAYAVELLYPGVEVTIGPVIEDGFYYDFAYQRPFTLEDLNQIEMKMMELADAGRPVRREIVSRQAARRFFEQAQQKYKVALIDAIPEGETLTLYHMGDFTDLCRGPHVPNTRFLKSFKLMKVAGAYWKGDSNNEMLQRIYGTAWANKKDLKTYLLRLEEAAKRDHRKLSKELDLYHLQDEAPGMIFWHPNGWIIWQEIEQYLRKELEKSGYKEVKTPILMDRSLWEKSGHWENYQENMFITESENRIYAIKPMNCPAHIEIFKRKIHSYRDLPLRLAEFGSCHRNEPSGSLHGLMRVRGFIQDDAHIFCTENQIESEVEKFHTLLTNIYRVFGFEDITVKLSLRPNKKAGSDAIWDKAEEGLRNALRSSQVSWEELPGEGAFYGPKVEYHIRDALGRFWQCGTIQLDFVLPSRLGAEYVTEHNDRATPVMLHRAIIGSFERFIAILIEHYSGHFPLWLAPTQLAILTISEKQVAYGEQVIIELKKAGIRAYLDKRKEKIGFKIRDNHLQKIPYIAIIGDKEVENHALALRHRAEDLGTLTVTEVKNQLQKEIKERFPPIFNALGEKHS